MSNYTITTNFGAKDSLPSTDVGKVIKGSEFTTEFTSIQTAIATKADTTGDTFTGVVNFSADVAVNTNTLFVDVSEGKVGIGTTSPDYPLDVTGSAQLSGGDLILRSDSDDADTQYIRFENYPSDIRTAYIRADYTSQTAGGGTALAFGANDHATATDTDSMVIDIEGNVGIGTASPQAPLHVHGDINLGNSAGADAADVEIASLNFYNRDTSGSAPNNASIIRAYSHSSTGSGGYLTFATSFGGESEGADATEKMRIDASGNVGIGTTDPQRELELTGTGNVYVRITAPTDDDSAVLELKNTQETWQIRNQDTNDDALEFIDDTATRLTIKKDGNVGIGATNPYVKTEIAGGDLAVGGGAGADNLGFEIKGVPLSAIPSAQVRGYIATADTGLGVRGDLLIAPRTSANTSVRFITGTSPTERMRIDASGNVGIGTTSPDSILDVVGADPILTIRDTSTSGSDSHATLRLAESGASDSLNLHYDISLDEGHLTFNYDNTGSNATERMRIDSSGNLLVGTTIATAMGTTNTGVVLRDNDSSYFARNSNGAIIAFFSGLGGAGSISLTGNTANYNTTSDERLKENITDSADAGSKVDAIQIRQFDWKADGSHQDYGVIAQELTNVAPEAVSEGDTEEDMMGVDYSKLVPMLIKEVQSLRSRVAELENV